jgi:hypothetical protein
MLTLSDIEEIEVKHTSTRTAPNEKTFDDEVWFMGHLKEIILSYRRDVPALCSDWRALTSQVAELKRENTFLSQTDVTAAPDSVAYYHRVITRLTAQVAAQSSEFDIAIDHMQKEVEAYKAQVAASSERMRQLQDELLLADANNAQLTDELRLARETILILQNAVNNAIRFPK